MNEIYIVWGYYNLLTLSYDLYPEYFIDDFMIALSDDNDMDIADNRILTEWREMEPMLQSLPLQVISRTCCYHRDGDHWSDMFRFRQEVAQIPYMRNCDTVGKEENPFPIAKAAICAFGMIKLSIP